MWDLILFLIGIVLIVLAVIAYYRIKLIYILFGIGGALLVGRHVELALGYVFTLIKGIKGIFG